MSWEKIKSFFVHIFVSNFRLKLLSLVLAVAFWFIVINVTDPPTTQTFRNVSVSILNSGVIVNDNKTMEILNDSNIVSTVTIRAPRSIIQEFGSSSDNITITADMKKLSADGTTVPLDVTTSKYSDKIESIRLSSDVLEVNIENRKTIQLPIRATTSGELESGYVLGDVNQAQNQVRVSGPESVVDSIARAIVDVVVTGFKENISTSADIVLYDQNGEVVPDDNLILNVSSVKVDVEILATKKVAVKFSSTGTPMEGYAATGEIESDADIITVAGSSAAIAKLETIEVPADALNISGLSSSLNAVVNIANYLPSGISLADATTSGKINVTVYIEALEEESYSVQLRNVSVLDIPEGYETTEWAMDEDYVEFTLVGLKQDLENVQLSALNLAVDFVDYENLQDVVHYRDGGEYELPLLMELPEGVKIKETVMVKVKLLK